jgi:hypothetical protein
MAWIKRNLFFTIGGVIALLLLGAAGFYVYKGWNHNRAAWDSLQEGYNSLQTAYNQKPSASAENIEAAKEQEKQIEDWIAQAKAHFTPVAPIPNPPDGVVTTEALAGSLRKTIRDMQNEAKDANVALPPDYSFSFAAERNLVTFAPNSLNPLAAHLGEVKALCEILFDAKVNALDGIQREIVSDNDTTGPQSDYLADKTTPVGDAAVKTPYMITFRCFSSDLANVLSKMASSEHCFIIKGINVTPASASAGPTDQNGNGGAPAANMPVAGNGGLQTVLDEQLLRVTMAVEMVKLTK